jgi:TPR repeat protein
LAKRPVASSGAPTETPSAADPSATGTTAAPAPTTPPPAPNPSENAGETHSATAVVEDGQSAAQPKPAEPAPTPEANAALPAGTPQQKAEDAAPATSESSATTKESKAEEPAVVAKETAPAQHSTAKPAPSKPEVSPAEPYKEDRLVAEGERYLYGTGGVRQDCERAQRDLLIGARATNPKAYTLLGAMYATGHCVGRDLPTAYKWFARALHEQPSNTRLQQNLQVIWNQMTPSEKQVAASRGQ